MLCCAMLCYAVHFLVSKIVLKQIQVRCYHSTASVILVQERGHMHIDEIVQHADIFQVPPSLYSVCFCFCFATHQTLQKSQPA